MEKRFDHRGLIRHAKRRAVLRLHHACFAILGMTFLSSAFLGCDDSTPPPLVPVEAEFRIGLPTGGADTGDLHVRGISVPDEKKQGQNSASIRTVSHRPGRLAVRSPLTIDGANSRLARLEKAGPTKDRMKWGLDQLNSHLQPPVTELRPGDVTFVQTFAPTPEPQPQPQPPANQGGIEIIDTPKPDAAPTETPASDDQPSLSQQVPEIIPTPEGKLDGAKAGLPSEGTSPQTTAPVERMADNSEKSGASPSDTSAGGLKSITDEGAKAIPKGLAPIDYSKWPTPDVAIFVTGQQNGYIEPCGCTGLEKQKGGVARRYTFMKQLMENGWDLVPVDAGNQVRRVGRQASIKLSWSTEALKEMKYQAVGFGPDDLRLPATDLLQLAASDSPEEATYVSANVVLYDESYVPAFKVVPRGVHRVGITTVLDPAAMQQGVSTDAEIRPAVDSAKAALAGMTAQNATFKLISFYGKEKDAAKLVKSVPGFDLIIVAGGYGEPTYQPQAIDGSTTKMILTGNKAMYTGLVGIYADGPMKYARVPLTHEFKDAPEMRKIMSEYQDHLKQIGLKELGLIPTPHLSGEKFVGTATCAQCHEDEFDIWSGSMHAHATDSIVSPPEDRGDVPRHFDPECISCHVTGWNPQGYSPYTSGYVSLKASKHLLGNGCENCHGPGESHSKAERDGSGVSDAEKAKWRKQMQLPLERAKEHCMKCHDLDNSPDFHEPDAFEDIYWPEIEH